ncbi:MAG TPA: class I SAM-dependent methyltransferase [Methylothermaceae bacterium]|nr:class I SAM-dependent methyltransferase [Methylothermaceae bacterium]
MNGNSSQAAVLTTRNNLVSTLRGIIYDHTFAKLTIDWYQAVLERLPEGAEVLDVGIGTGGAVAANANLILEKNLQVTGLDIDADYLERCEKTLAKAGLSDHVSVRLESVYDHQGGPYDAVYFSGSFMLLPDPIAALKHVLSLLRANGSVYFTQTFHDRPSPLAEKIKPILHRVTTIHFGRVTYWEDFQEVLQQAGAGVKEVVILKQLRSTSFRLIEAIPHQTS